MCCTDTLRVRVCVAGMGENRELCLLSAPCCHACTCSTPAQPSCLFVILCGNLPPSPRAISVYKLRSLSYLMLPLSTTHADEVLDGDNCYACDGCKQRCRAKRR